MMAAQPKAKGKRTDLGFSKTQVATLAEAGIDKNLADRARSVPVGYALLCVVHKTVRVLFRSPFLSEMRTKRFVLRRSRMANARHVLVVAPPTFQCRVSVSASGVFSPSGVRPNAFKRSISARSSSSSLSASNSPGVPIS
jgi:hypothetical protein